LGTAREISGHANEMTRRFFGTDGIRGNQNLKQKK